MRGGWDEEGTGTRDDERGATANKRQMEKRSRLSVYSILDPAG